MNDKLKKLVDSLESFGMSIPAHEKNAALIQQYADEQSKEFAKWTGQYFVTNSVGGLEVGTLRVLSYDEILKRYHESQKP